MMTLRGQLMIVLPLSLAAAWTGSLLASGKKATASAATDGADPAISPRRPSVAAPAADAKGKERSIRDIIASTSTDVLWNWLDVHGSGIGVNSPDSPLLFEILRELHAREGMKVWDVLLANQEAATRERLSDTFLGMLSSDDPWVAYELFLANKASFGARWGLPANVNVLRAASSISAEKFIEVMERSGYKDTNCWFGAELPGDFDYAGLIAHLQTSEHMPSGLPDHLVAKWARQSPKEAAEWLLAQPTPDDQGPMRALLDEDMVYQSTLLDLAESAASGRDEGLAAFAKLPAATLEKSWRHLTDNLHGKINPSVLDAARRMGSVDDYLVHSLLETRGKPEPDPSWDTVPAADRWRAVDLAEQKWRTESSSPIDDKAREEWRARLQTAWGTGN
jgi:hypothetical protein